MNVVSTGRDIPEEHCEAERRQEVCVPVRDMKRMVRVSPSPVLGIRHNSDVKKAHRLRISKTFF